MWAKSYVEKSNLCQTDFLTQNCCLVLLNITDAVAISVVSSPWLEEQESLPYMLLHCTAQDMSFCKGAMHYDVNAHGQRSVCCLSDTRDQLRAKIKGFISLNYNDVKWFGYNS